MELYLSVFAIIHINDVYNDHKRHKANTRYSTTHEKAFEATNWYPDLKQPRYAPECKNAKERIEFVYSRIWKNN